MICQSSTYSPGIHLLDRKFKICKGQVPVELIEVLRLYFNDGPVENFPLLFQNAPLDLVNECKVWDTVIAICEAQLARFGGSLEVTWHSE